MPLRPTATVRPGLACTVLALALAACGGGHDEGGPGTDLRFKARASQAVAGGAPTQPLSAAETAEVQQRSRAWAARNLLQAPAGSNTVTLPPLYFGTAFSLAAAADGDTLAALRQPFPPVSSPAVQAELQRGLQRSVRAGENTVLGTSFLDTVTLVGRPGTLGSLSLLPLTAAQLAAEPNLRVSIEDRISASLGWNLLGSQQATWTSPQGGTLAVTVLNVAGATRPLAGPGWVGQAMRLAGGPWLVKFEPTADIAGWGAAELEAALAQAQSALGLAGAEADAVWQLPALRAAAGTDWLDTRGMAPAQDRVTANLRLLDGGGTYLTLPSSAPPALTLGPATLSYEGSLRADYVFSPQNVFGPGSFAGGSTLVNVGFTPCPDATLTLRPFFLALVQPSGNIALLARLNTFPGTACTPFIRIGPG